MADIIALTCASGKQCSAIIPMLYTLTSRYRLRLVVHSSSSFQRLSAQYPDAEVLQANLDSPTDRARVVDGVSVLYYVSPTFHPHEAPLGQGMIDAACAEQIKKDSKFSHFVLSSVLHTHLRKLLNHDRKRYIEEYLCESPLSWTILQASHFMDNAMGRILELRHQDVTGLHNGRPVFKAAHNPDASFSFSCVRDHAEASVKVILEGAEHFSATYQLVSTWPITYRDYINQVGAAAGVQDIVIETSRYEDMVDAYCEMIFGDVNAGPRYREGPARLLLYYNERGLPGNPRTLEWLLGRPPTSPAELASLRLAEMKQLRNGV
jgi:uncharacterized protein YbjT (DUF2867 family)